MASPRGGGDETVTLQAVTETPRRRTLVASFVRERTPPGELPLGRRKRLKAESSARSRARCRLDPEKHDQYLIKERERKTLSRGVQYGPWRQKACERIRAERDRSRAEQIAAGQQLLIAEREERGQIGSRGSKHKAVRQGPPGWCDTGGWIWTINGRISDVSRIEFDDGSEGWTSGMWREGGSALCGICACEQCHITQHCGVGSARL